MTHIRLTDVIGDDADYVDENSAIAIEGLPLEAWRALLEACAILVDGNADDVIPGIDCRVAKTHEALADWDDSRDNDWRKRGRRTDTWMTGDLGLSAWPARLFENVQMNKGQERGDYIVIDLGECRAVLSA